MKNWRPLIVALSLMLVCLVLIVGLGLRSSAAAPSTVESMPGRVPIVVVIGPERGLYRLPPPPQFSPRRPATAIFTIEYVPAGSTNALGDSCLDWPAGSQSALSYAANVWGALLNSTVPIKIAACWTSLSPGVLGHAATDNFYRNFTGAPQTNTWYPVSLANALSGTDQNGGTAEMHIAYSGNGVSWYFGTDGSTPGGQIDFVSVVLHEIAHGLGFAGTMSYSGGVGSWGGGTAYPSIYDRFAENGSGQSLINTALFPNPSAALGTQLTSDNVYFDGANANAANGGTRPKLYAPATWAPGSSYAHLDYTTFAGTINRLMVYAISAGQSIHDPGPVTNGIFKDEGWTMGTPGTPTPTPTATATLPLGANKLNLPLILRQLPPATATPTATPTTPSGPTPGYWKTSTGSHEFYVTPDQANVRNHAVNILINGGPCNGQVWKVTRITPAAIVSNQYSFSGTFYANGTFNSTTTASVTDGLNSHPVASCGNITGGPWPRDYAWANSSQPILPATFVGPVTAESSQNAVGYEIVRIEQP